METCIPANPGDLSLERWSARCSLTHPRHRSRNPTMHHHTCHSIPRTNLPGQYIETRWNSSFCHEKNVDTERQGSVYVSVLLTSQSRQSGDLGDKEYCSQLTSYGYHKASGHIKHKFTQTKILHHVAYIQLCTCWLKQAKLQGMHFAMRWAKPSLNHWCTEAVSVSITPEDAHCISILYHSGFYTPRRIS